MRAKDQWDERLAGLGAEIAALRARIAADGMARYHAWRPRIARREFAGGALNLAHYLSFRETDLRPLQRRLMAMGLSSLGRAESHVLATLDAVGAAIAAISGTPDEGPRLPAVRQFFRGEAQLAANATAAFGPAARGRAGRVMVTLGTNAADDPGVLRDLVHRGANLVRINCAHDGPETWARMIANARAAAGKGHIRVLMDIAGPKVRTALIHAAEGHDRIDIGTELLLARAIDPARAAFPVQFTCSAPEILPRLKKNDAISFDDGVMLGTITRVVPEGFVVRIDAGKLKGLKLKPEKGLLFPGVDLGLDPLTAKDRADLDFVAMNADLIGYSFVESAAHVALLQNELRRRRADWQRLVLVAKIETPRAVASLPEIIVEAAGRQPLAVMIARGDLAIELGYERLAEMQDEILWLCEAAHVPAIWATEVLNGLIKSGVPSRGEMTDAVMAGRAECVMLNKGPNIGLAVDTLTRLLARMGEHQVKKTPTLRALRSWKHKVPADA
jgi:pyruvate kinase